MSREKSTYSSFSAIIVIDYRTHLHMYSSTIDLKFSKRIQPLNKTTNRHQSKQRATKTACRNQKQSDDRKKISENFTKFTNSKSTKDSSIHPREYYNTPILPRNPTQPNHSTHIPHHPNLPVAGPVRIDPSRARFNISIRSPPPPCNLRAKQSALPENMLKASRVINLPNKRTHACQRLKISQ